MTWLRQVLPLSALALLAVCALSPPALAAPPPSRHCVVSLVAGHPEPARKDCFASFRDAISFATGGHVADAPENARTAGHSRAFRRDLAAAAGREPKRDARVRAANHENAVSGCCTVLSVEYELGDFGGNTLVYRGSHGCDDNTDVDWSIGYVGDDWNDDISSFIRSGQCGVRHFEHAQFGGAMTSWQQQDCCMGVMNNETSSIRWR